MENLFKNYQIPIPTNPKVKHEFQELGLELEPFYGKLIWTLFYKPWATEFKIRQAHERNLKGKRVFELKYLIGIIKKL